MMFINPLSKNRSALKHEKGLSLIEVLISFSFLIVIIASVFQLRLSSVRRIEQSGALDRIQNTIRKDIAYVRKQALKWKCQQGTACTGDATDQNNPSRYQSDHCSKDNPYEDFSVTTEVLQDESEDLKVQRKVVINGSRIDITYVGTLGDQTITTETSIVPQAMNWC